MFPGLTTRMSEKNVTTAATITAEADIIRLVGTTNIATIRPKGEGVGGQIIVLVPVGNTLALLTTGNIAIGVTMADSRATVLVYSKIGGVWYPGAIS